MYYVLTIDVVGTYLLSCVGVGRSHDDFKIHLFCIQTSMIPYKISPFKMTINILKSLKNTLTPLPITEV